MFVAASVFALGKRLASLTDNSLRVLALPNRHHQAEHWTFVCFEVCSKALVYLVPARQPFWSGFFLLQLENMKR